MEKKSLVYETASMIITAQKLQKGSIVTSIYCISSK